MRNFFLQDDSGAVTVEYSLILGLSGGTTFAVIQAYGAGFERLFQETMRVLTF